MPTPENALRGTQLVASVFEREVFPLVQSYQPTNNREWCLWGYFQRLLPMIRSLAVLVQPSFFQLTLAANRNLLEILVDVVHLAHNEPQDVVERILAWEDSAKLKAAEAAVSYLERSSSSDAEYQKIFSGFIATRGADIRAARHRYWPPHYRHPDRWSAHNLLEDCRRADKLEALGLEAFYETQYRQMNWRIHGSGFAGIRGLEIGGFDMVYAYSQMKSAEFAQKATLVVLQELGLLRQIQGRLAKLAADFDDIVGSAG